MQKHHSFLPSFVIILIILLFPSIIYKKINKKSPVFFFFYLQLVSLDGIHSGVPTRTTATLTPTTLRNIEQVSKFILLSSIIIKNSVTLLGVYLGKERRV